MVFIGETLAPEFTTQSLATGAAKNADALPTGVLRRNGSTVGAAVVTITNLGTGRYKAAVLIDVAHGWVAGDTWSIEVAWTMEGTADICRAFSGQVKNAPAEKADWTAARAAKVDNLTGPAALEATLTAIKGGGWTTETLKAIYDLVGTRLATAGYTAPPSAAAIRAEMDANSADLNTIIAGILGLPSAAQIDTQLTGTHGAGDWGPTTGTGQFQVTLTVRDDLAAPIPGLPVTVRNNAMTDPPLAWGVTDAAGQVQFWLNNSPGGSPYKVGIGANPSYVSIPTQNLVVAGTTTPAAYVLNRQSTTPPVAVGLCTVRFYCTLNGRPQAGHRVKAALARGNQAANNQLLSNQIDEDTSDAAGIAELQLARLDQFVKGSGVYQITVTAPDNTVTHDVKVTIPNADTANFEDLIPA